MWALALSIDGLRPWEWGAMESDAYYLIRALQYEFKEETIAEKERIAASKS